MTDDQRTACDDLRRLNQLTEDLHPVMQRTDDPDMVYRVREFIAHATREAARVLAHGCEVLFVCGSDVTVVDCPVPAHAYPASIRENAAEWVAKAGCGAVAVFITADGDAITLMKLARGTARV